MRWASCCKSRAGLKRPRLLFSKPFCSSPTTNGRSEICNTYRQLGQLDEAVAHCRGTLERHPSNAVAYNSLGTLLLIQDKMEEAKAAFQQAIRLKPDFAAAISNLGHTYRNPGQLDNSLNYYRQAMALEPGDPTAHSNLIYVMHFHPGYSLQAARERMFSMAAATCRSPEKIHSTACQSGRS